MHESIAENEMRQNGVYAVINERNGKLYIGSTGRGFKTRLKEHQRSLRCGDHCSLRLQRDWDRQEGEDFLFKILETVPSKELVNVGYLLGVEQMWIDATVCLHRKLGYNSYPIAGSPFGYGRKRYIATNPKGQQFSVLYLSAFCEKHDLSEYHMRDCARGVSRFHKGWRCEFVDGSTPEWIDKTEECKKDYIVTSPNGEVYQVKGLNHFCKEHGLRQSGMSKVARGKLSSYKGWKVIFADGSTPKYFNQVALRRKQYIVTTPNGEEYLVEHLKEFCDRHGIGRNGQLGLQKVATGKTPSYKNWKCRLADGSLTKLESNERPVKYIATHPNGIRFPVRNRNMDQFCRENGLIHASMANVAKGLNTHHKDWGCVFADGSSPACKKEPRNKQWILTDPNGIEHLVVNLHKFAREQGLDPKKLSRVAHGQALQHKRWKCCRAD